MITLLLVGADAGGFGAAAAARASVEIMTARATEDALEKLARNRRIDAVLLLAGAETAAIAAAIREEDPGSPPLFAPESAGSIPGVRPLATTSAAEMLRLTIHALSADR